MDKRAILFLIVSSVLVFSYMMVEATFAPPRPPNRNEEVADQDLADDVDKSDPSDQGQDSSDSTDEDSGGGAKDLDPKRGDESTGQGDAELSPDQSDIDLADEGDQFPDRLVTLGSLSEGSQHRGLATFNSRGGTLHRLELNERLSNGRYRYAETDYPHGYLGNLEFEPTLDSRGLTIRLVGSGTPASLATPLTEGASAGLREGDLLL